MKTILLSITTFITLNVIAQTEKNVPDTTKFKIGTTEFIIIDHNDGQVDTIQVEGKKKDEKEGAGIIRSSYESFGHWSGFEFGVNTLINSAGGSSFNHDFLEINPSQSWNFSWNFAQVEIPFKTAHVGLVSGLGLEHSRYGFQNNYQLKISPDSTWAVMDTTKTYFKNQLRTWSLNLPILLEFNTSKYDDNNFYLNAGVIGGVHFGTKTYKKYTSSNGESKDKIKGLYNVNPFKVLATARLGYKSVGIFVNYNMLSLFQPTKSELAYPLTFGIRIGA
jgi:hypothetical protein